MKLDCGIYAITSPSGKQYIGQAVSIRRRWTKHLYDLRKGSHHCVALQNAFKKYGESSLVFSVLQVAAEDQLDFLEQKNIDERKRALLYNTATFVGASMRGRLHSPLVRAKLSASKMGEKNHQWGKPRTAEIRQKIAAGLKAKGHPNLGKTLSPETRAKIGAGKKGQVHTIESRKKMSLSRAGQVIGIAQREKISSALKGRLFTPEWREKISLARKGSTLSDEAKALRRASLRVGISPRNRAVTCLELGMEFINISAAVSYLVQNGKPKASTSSISGACSGKHKTAYGYTWAYVNIGELDAATRLVEKHYWNTPENRRAA